MVVRRASPRGVTGLDAFRARVRSEMMVLKKVPADRLRFVTIIIAAHRVKLGDDVSALVTADLANFENDFRNCLFGHLTRGVRVAGVFEVDIVHPRLLTAGKRALLRDAGVDEIATDEQVIIVHIHMLIDCRGYESPEALGHDLRKQFTGPRRVFLENLHSDSTALEIENIAGYCTKHIRAYSSAYDSDGRKVKFTINFDREWAAWLDRLYCAISLDRTVYSTTSSRAGQKSGCKHPEAKPLTPQGFLTSPSEDQLRHMEEDKTKSEERLEETAKHLHSTLPQYLNNAHRQRSQMIAEQCAEPFDDDRPMIFYMMKRIMRKTIDPSHRMKSVMRNACKTGPHPHRAGT